MACAAEEVHNRDKNRFAIALPQPRAMVGLDLRPGIPEPPMCRWIAYRGDTVPLEQYVTEPAHSLVAQSVRALESTASTNGDGFGLGWYGTHAEPGLYREVRALRIYEGTSEIQRLVIAGQVLAAAAAVAGDGASSPAGFAEPNPAPVET